MARPFMTIFSVVVSVGVMEVALTFASQEKTMPWPEHIQQVLDNTAPLKHPRGKRLPLFLWPAINPGVLTDEQAETLVRELDKRGVALVCRWDHARFEESLAQALPVARAQQKLDLLVCVDATPCLYSFFNGEEKTAHRDEQGKPFWDPSFGKPDMGCPFAIEHRRPEIRSRIERFADAYRDAGLRLGFVFADWEVDGPMAWNGAWDAAKRCVRCREKIPEMDNFLAFQKALYDLRADLQRDVYAEPLRERFPAVLVGNYGVYPHDGFRYWYDYFEKEQDWYPGLRDQKALYRHWADEFTGSRYTFGMPVVYTWSRMWYWYDFDVPDYRWFRPMLLEASNAGKHAWPGLPVVAFIHWHTTDPPSPPDPEMKQMSRWAYQELLWHMLLRGTSTFFMWCPSSENAEEIRAVHEVWAAAQEYGEFLEKGTALCYDVPERPGTVLSALRLGHRLLVRRTDFTPNPENVSLKVAGMSLTVGPGEGCRVLDLSVGADRSDASNRSGVSGQSP